MKVDTIWPFWVEQWETLTVSSSRWWPNLALVGSFTWSWQVLASQGDKSMGDPGQRWKRTLRIIISLKWNFLCRKGLQLLQNQIHLNGGPHGQSYPYLIYNCRLFDRDVGLLLPFEVISHPRVFQWNVGQKDLVLSSSSSSSFQPWPHCSQYLALLHTELHLAQKCSSECPASTSPNFISAVQCHHLVHCLHSFHCVAPNYPPALPSPASGSATFGASALLFMPRWYVDYAKPERMPGNQEDLWEKAFY